MDIINMAAGKGWGPLEPITDWLGWAMTTLQDHQQRYRFLADAMPLVVWTAQPDGTVDYFNRNWYDYTGTTPEQTSGWGWQQVLHPQDRPLCLERWHQALETGEPYEIEYRFRRADGSYRWHLSRALPIRDSSGQINLWVGTSTDIDHQKRQETADRVLAAASQELVRSLDYREGLVRMAQLAVPQVADWCVVDLLEDDRQIRRLAIAHTDPSQVELAWRLHQHYPEAWSDQVGVAQVLQTGVAQLVPEIPATLLPQVARDQHHLERLQELGLTSYMIVPLQARGRTFGAITLVTAESQRRYDAVDLAFAKELAHHAALAVDNARLFQAAQQELKERKQAEAELQARAAELAQLTQALAKRNQELDQFAYVTSHDLKAPLRAIANLSQWLEEDLDAMLTGETRHQMQLLRGRVHRMEALIDGILQYSRIGRVATPVETVDVAQLIQEVIDSLAPPPGFAIAVAPDLPVLTTERLPLTQTFANLIGNAMKHHDRNQGQIRIGGRDLEHSYEFWVSDDGPGIEPRFHDKVFDMFQTLEARDKVESTGIGLSLVKKIVEHRGGTIRLCSPDPDTGWDRGTTFRFTWAKAIPPAPLAQVDSVLP